MCEKQRSATRHITAAIMDVAEIDGGQARIAMGHLEAAERALANVSAKKHEEEAQRRVAEERADSSGNLLLSAWTNLKKKQFNILIIYH